MEHIHVHYNLMTYQLEFTFLITHLKLSISRKKCSIYTIFYYYNVNNVLCALNSLTFFILVLFTFFHH